MAKDDNEANTAWIPVGEEPQPAGSITECTILRNDGISAVSQMSGEIDKERYPATGMYHADTRHLSRLLLSFSGVAPVLLDAREFGNSLTAIFTNSGLQGSNGEDAIPPQSLILRRKRVLETAFVESLSVSNYCLQALDVELHVEFDADFEDIFVVRGLQRDEIPRPVRKSVQPGRVRFAYDGIDGVERSTLVQFRPRPDQLEECRAAFHLHLEPRETNEIDIVVTTGTDVPLVRASDADARARKRETEWLKTLTSVETDDEAVNCVLEQAMRDIYALRTNLGDLEYLAAGVPWYDTLFGRDSLIASIEMAAFTPELLKVSLEVLARNQATTVDPAHDATPGKIPHELRWGELAHAGKVPFGRYYGSIDATPLFLIAANEYFRWTEDDETLQHLWPSIERAMAWCSERIAGDAHGFLAYKRRSSGGLENQGWKDSSDAIVWPDGRLVQPPIALIEVQGYVAAACRAYTALSERFGSASDCPAPFQVNDFLGRVDQAFSDPDLGYVLCLDGDGQPVPTPASNAAHMLWVDAARRDLAERVAQVMMRPEMFSGWGVRTLGTEVPRYNPLGYHVGTVWPHDNAIALAGFRRYGLNREAEKLSTALIDAALNFPNYRVPEVFSGDDRELRHVPTPYPVSSRPQAWAAASIPYVLTSMLGVCPGPDGQLHVVRPQLPKQLNWVRVRNLRVGGGCVDLFFQRHDDMVSVEARNLRKVNVVLSDTMPDRLLPTR